MNKKQQYYGRPSRDTNFGLYEKDFERKKLKSNELLIKVLLSGVCGTDFEVIDGYKPDFVGTLGHEFVGKIIELGKNTSRFKIGDKVVADINIWCNECKMCTLKGASRRNHCFNRKVLGLHNISEGTFSEFIKLPEKNCMLINSIDEKYAVFSEPLAAGCRIVEQMKEMGFDPSEAVIIGDGNLAKMICAAFYSSYGKKLSIIGKHTSNLNILKDADLINQTFLFKNIEQENFENRFPVVIIATNNLSGLKLAVDIVQPLGMIFLKTTCADSSVQSDVFNQMVVKEIKLFGSRCGSSIDAVTILNKKSKNIFKVLDSIIEKSETFSLSEIDKALDYARKHKTKVFIKP
eukprot:snap_masked-scaffold_8-processed-gene-8.21-mRNA-1 protein AED:1.00 eAED:1.00 QI:0/-1/0/0/-1/1/1/0/347